LCDRPVELAQAPVCVARDKTPVTLVMNFVEGPEAEALMRHSVSVQRLTALTVAISLVLAACSAQPPVPSPSPVVAPSPSPACQRADSVPSVSTRSATPRPSTAATATLPVGRLTVLEQSPGASAGTTVTQLDARGVRTTVLPAPLLPFTELHVSADGSITSGLLVRGSEVLVWLYDARTTLSTTIGTDLPPPGDTPVVRWTSDGRHAAYVRDAEAKATDLFVVDLFGKSQKVGLPQGVYVYLAEWRTDRELSLMASWSGPVYPLSGATVLTWDLDHPGLTQVVPNVRAVSGAYLWSTDGTTLIYGDMDRAEGSQRFVRRTAQGTNVVFGSDDLRRLANACDLTGDVSLVAFGWGWSPDGQRLAAIGKLPPSECCWFLAVGAVSGGPPALFRAPSSCYLNGQGGWIDSERILVELTGPTCGATDREGRAVIVDARSGKALGEFPIGRKSALLLSPDGRWVANSSEGGINVISLADPTQRLVLPMSGTLVSWCCR